ncbi:hypothetical protein TWF102_000749 [Orbilia oligospora]|uniref:Uncharacterized protein n=1 Tax=Orbilia oligospora TaxID=2813651 RepID=A0A7C8N1S1_ORBOL|nr:hypothetical protein TWF102_000749 [Orbilia oligospora]KAF3094504.1 hypothetical protein TWF103_010493 [Orbilia oligospora]
MVAENYQKPTLAPEPLAIIGFSFRFPSGVEDPDSLWKTLVNGEVALKDVPENRFNVANFRNIRAAGSTDQKPKGYHIGGDITAFDAPFFSITAEEAMAMDPQQRILLESSYHALENSGVTLAEASGSRTSVHVGALSMDYLLASSREPESAAKYTSTGTEDSILANRLSWFFNLKGPSLTVKTACSSSLVAMDIACQLLSARKTDMALVAGSGLIHSPDFHTYLGNMGFLSPDYRCHSFDSRGNGYARAEGFGVIIMKRLSDAVRDGNTIRAVIRSSASNSDGHTPGITQPSGESQLALIRETYERAGLSMEPTRFCEAHGTGTVVGDPIESHAIGAAFRGVRSDDDPIHIGALKSNFGHMEAASGIAGIIKTILVLERGIIPPIADLEELNPAIDHEYYRLKFPVEPIPWPSQGLRRASVNSFGFGGTNAHIVMDDAYNALIEYGLEGLHNTIAIPLITNEITTPSSEDPGYETSSPVADTQKTRSEIASDELNAKLEAPAAKFRPQLITLSAADREGTKRIGELYSEYFKFSVRNSKTAMDICQRFAYTLDKRDTLEWKSYAVVSSLETLTSINSVLSLPKRSFAKPSLAFVFTGQGAQYAQMGMDLMQYDVFARSIQQSSQYLAELGCLWDLEEEMFKNASTSRMNDPDISQPGSTALQIALVDLLEHIGLKPTVVLGHSSGEVAAAYCKGALSHKSAMKIAYFRGMGGAAASKDPNSNGTMMVVGLGEKEVFPIINHLSSEGYNDLHIACINSPRNVTIAGGVGHIKALKATLEAQHPNVFARQLKVSCAYHSPHMKNVAKEYFSRAGSLESRHEKNITPMISYLNGEEVLSARLQELDYWVTNMCSPVNFLKSTLALDRLALPGKSRNTKLDLRHRKAITVTNILEIGPHSALKTLLRDTIQTFESVQDIQYDSVLVRGTPSLNSFLQAMGSLKCSGFHFDSSYVNNNGPRLAPIVDLPSYPFLRTRSYWKENRRSQIERSRAFKPNEILGIPTPDSQPHLACWRNYLSRSKSDWIEDHIIGNSVIYPGAGMITMAVEALNQYVRDLHKAIPTGFHLKNVKFLTSMQIPKPPKSLETMTQLRPVGDGILTPDSWFEFTIISHEPGHWKKNCQGSIRAEFKNENHDDERPKPVVGSSPHEVPTSEFYEALFQAGYGFGPGFQRIRKLEWSVPRQTHGLIDAYRQPNSQENDSRAGALESAQIIHPTTLDALLQLPLANVIRESPTSMPTLAPTELRKLWISGAGLNRNASTLSATAWTDSHTYRGVKASVAVVDAENNTRILYSGLEMIRVSGGDGATGEVAAPANLHTCWTQSWETFINNSTDKPSAISGDIASSSKPKFIEIHVHNPSVGVKELANALRSKLQEGKSTTCEILNSMDTARLEGSTADLKIVLWDVDRPSVLFDLNEKELLMIQRALSGRQDILWIQTFDVLSENFSSEHLIDGLSRVVREEQALTNFATLKTGSAEVSARVQAISKVAQVILSSTDSLNTPQTYRESNGYIQFLKLTELPELTQSLQLARPDPIPAPARWDSETPMRIHVGSPGVLDTIHFIEDETHGLDLQDNDVEVEVKSVGLNFKDCLIALGALDENSIGQELAGIVTRIGPDTEGHGLKPGDRVCGFAQNAYRTFYRNRGSSFSRIPGKGDKIMSFTEAASIPINFATAWHSLRYIAQLSAGETVLIHSAAGGTGQAAVQIAKHLGAIVFATVGTQDKREMLTSKYDIPPTHIFNSRDSAFTKEVMRLTGGQGVDVVFNSLPDKILFSSWDCVAPFGRFIEIGKKDIQAQSGLPMGQFEKNCSFSAIDLGHMFLQRPKKVTRLINEVLENFEAGVFHTVHFIHRYKISNLVEAFRLMQAGKSTGKIVVNMESMDEVQAIVKPKQRSSFNLEASYVIAGGLGGLGRDMARWMAARGAKNLILLSRSGPRTAEALKLIEDLQAQGVACFTPACDISDDKALEATINSLTGAIPPIKGCIQASMVLKSSVFTNMTHLEWTSTIAPKVAGSWNLHCVLPKDMEFFIFLSSFQGLTGARTQGNYAAANTYMDALAQHRVAHGLKAMSLQLGLMDDDGYLAEHHEQKEMMLALNSSIPVQRSEFHALLDYYLAPDATAVQSDQAVMTLGLNLLHIDPDFDPFGTSWGRNPMFQNLRRLMKSETSNASPEKNITTRFATAADDKEATEVVLTTFIERIASTIAGVDPQDIDHNKPVQAYGIDSLQTMELRSWFLRYFKSDVPTFKIIGAASLTDLVQIVVARSSLRTK